MAEVAEGFLHYLQAHPHMPPGPLASFVWVASKLLLIKSQMLLPRPPLPKADDEEEDPGDELVRRLSAYKRVQEVASWLRSRETEGLRSYERPATLQPPAPRPKREPEGLGLDGVTLAKLTLMVQKRMQLALPAMPTLGTAIEGHKVTVEEMLAFLRKRLKASGEDRIPLAEEFVAAANRSRTDLVVLFMAVLEVVRRKLATAEQDEMFGEIWLVKSEA